MVIISIIVCFQFTSQSDFHMHSIRDFDVAFLPPATEWAKVIFTVRNSSCGKVYTPQADTPTPADTHPEQTLPPPWTDTHLPGQTPTSLGRQPTSLGRPPGRHHPPGKHPQADIPLADTTPWANTPLPRADTSLGTHPTRHTPPKQRSPPSEMATAADGTHPTEMHSCFHSRHYVANTSIGKRAVGKTFLFYFDVLLQFSDKCQLASKYNLWKKCFLCHCRLWLLLVSAYLKTSQIK